jgi:hypothetical protein
MDLSFLKDKKNLHNTVVSLSALAAGLLVKKGFDLVYEKIYRQDPPDQNKDDNVNLIKFLAYSVITGVAINLVKNSVMRSGSILVDKKLE